MIVLSALATRAGGRRHVERMPAAGPRRCVRRATPCPGDRPPRRHRPRRPLRRHVASRQRLWLWLRLRLGLRLRLWLRSGQRLWLRQRLRSGPIHDRDPPGRRITDWNDRHSRHRIARGIGTRRDLIHRHRPAAGQKTADGRADRTDPWGIPADVHITLVGLDRAAVPADWGGGVKPWRDREEKVRTCNRNRPAETAEVSIFFRRGVAVVPQGW